VFVHHALDDGLFANDHAAEKYTGKQPV